MEKNRYDVEGGFGGLEDENNPDFILTPNSLYANNNSTDPRSPLLSSSHNQDDDHQSRFGEGDLTKSEKMDLISNADQYQEEEDDDEDANEETRNMINQMKSLVGLGDIPNDATWLKLSYHDYDRGVVEERVLSFL